MDALRRRPFSQGFTLVEMMIAMALVGMLTAVIYGLFVRTSDALLDVEGMSDALDEARFGIEHIRQDLQAAGSQSTPNAEVDPWIRPRNESLTVHGVRGYSGWQNQSADDLGDDDVFGDLAESNPGSAFSGIVLSGAYDIPASFFVSFPAVTSDDDFVVESTERGMQRIVRYDPFDTSVVSGLNTSDSLGDQLADVAGRRLLRVTDTQGFSQILPIASAAVGTGRGGAGGEGTIDGDEMGLEVTGLHFRSGDEQAGFEETTADDVSFDAAMIDTYWYSVEPAPDDPRNLQLVRQRLDAGAAAAGLDDPGDDVVDDAPRLVVADHVVDFRIWFDCVDNAGTPNMTNQSWEDEWDVEHQGDCVGAGSQAPERARMAHVRLSTRTPNENANRPHLDLDGVTAGFENDDGQMRTYEVYDYAEGSAGVVTLHGSVELSNFSMRNIGGI